MRREYYKMRCKGNTRPEQHHGCHTGRGAVNEEGKLFSADARGVRDRQQRGANDKSIAVVVEKN